MTTDPHGETVTCSGHPPELSSDPVSIAGLAGDKGARVLPMPQGTRRELMNTVNNFRTKVTIGCYRDEEDGALRLLE